jgi:hypothetical protein
VEASSWSMGVVVASAVSALGASVVLTRRRTLMRPVTT